MYNLTHQSCGTYVYSEIGNNGYSNKSLQSYRKPLVVSWVPSHGGVPSYLVEFFTLLAKSLVTRVGPTVHKGPKTEGGRHL